MIVAISPMELAGDKFRFWLPLSEFSLTTHFVVLFCIWICGRWHFQAWATSSPNKLMLTKQTSATLRCHQSVSSLDYLFSLSFLPHWWHLTLHTNSWLQGDCYASFHGMQISHWPMANPKGGKWKNLNTYQKISFFRNPDLIIPAMSERVRSLLSVTKNGEWRFFNTCFANLSICGILLVIKRVGVGLGSYWYLPQSSKYL